MKSAAILGRLTSELDKMAREHVERSQADYLEYGVAAADGSISPPPPGDDTVTPSPTKPMTV